MSDVAILTAIAERLDGTAAASFRGVPNDVLDTGVWAGVPEAEAARRALVSPRFEVTFVESDDENGMSELATTHITRVVVQVDTVYAFQALANLDVATRRTLYALAKTNADLARDALLAPGQLVTTSAAVATGLCSGCLARQLSSSDGGIDAASGTLRWSQRFDAYVTSTVAGNVGQPDSIPNCLAWWTAGVGNAYIGSTTDICRVLDRTGNNNNLVANTLALMPALTGSPAYLDFAGELVSGAVYDGDAFLVAPCTFVFAVQWDLVNQVTRSGAWNFGSAGTRTTTFLAREGAGANADRIVSYDGVADVYGPVITGATPHIVTLRYGTSAPYLELRVDGAAASITDIGGALVAGTTSFFTLGSSFSSTAAFDGRFYEGAIFGAALTDAQALLVETYMADRIGLSI